LVINTDFLADRFPFYGTVGKWERYGMLGEGSIGAPTVIDRGVNAERRLALTDAQLIDRKL